MQNKRKLLAITEEAQNFAIIVEELLLVINFASTEGLFHILAEVIISGDCAANLRVGEWVIRGALFISLGLAQINEKLAGVFITIVDADATAVNANIKAYSEILRHEWRHTIGFNNLMALKEGAHGHASVNNLGLGHQNAFVFKEVVHIQVMDAMVLNAILHDGLFKITIEAQHLFVKLDEVGLVEFFNVGTLMVNVLLLGHRLGHVSLFLREASVTGL